MDSQHDDQGEEPNLLELVQFTSMCLALGIPPHKVAGDYFDGLEELRQRGSLTLKELAGARAMVARGSHEDATEWTTGFREGYLAAWGAAVLRILSRRGIFYGKEIHRTISTCPDPDVLTYCVDRALTVTDATDLFTGYPGHPQPSTS